MPAFAGTVVSLNYHEVSNDPRVLKQARALSEHGYRVHVFCNTADGLPEADAIGNVRVTRFPCFSGAELSADDANHFAFLHRSGPALLARFLTYARACEGERRFNHFVGQMDPELLRRLSPDYYKKHRGLKRLRRKFVHTWSRSRLKIGAGELGGDRQQFKRLFKGRVGVKALRHARKALFQAQSLVFASNLMRLDLPEDVCAVHAHDIYCLPAGVLLAQKFGVPLIYDAHEYEPARATKMDATGPNLPELLEQDCFPFVSRIVTVSESIAELYRERFSGPAPVVIMNSPETSRTEFDNASDDLVNAVCIRKNAGLADDRALVVFTGGVQRGHRGMDIVVEALTRLPNVTLVCLGPRHAGNDAWLMEHAAAHGVSDRIKLLPSVDARHVPLAIRSADVAICPIQDVSLSYRFSMPNKLFEAVFARVPICVSNLPDMRRFVEDLGVGISMDQTDPASIAQAIAHVLKNREQFTLTPEAEDRLMKSYSWSAQVQKLRLLYEDILADAHQIGPSRFGVLALP